MDSPIFIVGCPRSGTTLLSNLLRSHPRLTFPGESHFIPKFYRAYGDPHNGRDAVRLASRILKVHWVRVWNLELKPADFACCRSFRQVVCRLYEAWTRKENKPRWGDKTPQYVTEIPLLLQLFPEAQIIHIYRDGRDVALSWLRMQFEPRNLFTAAHFWKERVDAGRRTGVTLPAKTYFEVRYEALLSRPKATMVEVCDFLGEPFCDAVLQPDHWLRDTRLKMPGERGHFMISNERIVDTNFNKWQQEMSPKDRALFESIAGDLLLSLGYETEGKARRIPKREQYLWRAHHCVLYWITRLRGLDRRELVSTFWQFQLAKRRARR